MKKTQVQLKESTVLRLKKMQESLSETYDDIINKLLDEVKKDD